MARRGMEQVFREELRRRYSARSEPTPSARGFTPDFPVFKQYGATGASRFYGLMRHDKRGRVYIYSPEKISTQEYDQMRMDGQIRAGLMLLKLPIQRSRWQINCQDKDIANFVQEILKPIWPTMIRHILLALDFGFVVAEDIWKTAYDLKISSTQAALGTVTEKRYPISIALERLMMIDPLTLKLLAWGRSGQYAGFEQFTPFTSVVSAEKSFHFANEMEFDELYGVSRLKPCYPYWLYKTSMYAWANVGYEKSSIPVRKVIHPQGAMETGQGADGSAAEVDFQDIALNIGWSLDSQNVVALPSSVYAENGAPHWDVEFMENPFDGAAILAYIDHLNAEILKALLIPELALNVGSSGSYDLAQEQIRFFMLGLEALGDQIAEAVTTQVVQRLVRYNFGKNAPQARFVFQPLADDVKEGLTNVLLETVGSGQPMPLKDGSQMLVDWQKVAEDSGIPVDVLKEEELATYRDAQSANQAAMPQDPMMGGPGEEGGGDMPFGKPPGGGPERGGYGSPGGASNRPGDRQQPNPDDDESGEMGLTELMETWSVVDGELVWCPN